jgi:hypothetical protein
MRRRPQLTPKRIASLLVLACIGLCALAASAAGGVGKPSAQITVMPFGSTPGKAADAIVDVAISPRSAAAARLVIYVPAGWGMPSGTVGSTLGIVDLSVLDDAGLASSADVLGTLAVGDPSLGADATAQACAPGPHTAVWVDSFKVGGQPTTLRFYVDATSAGESSLGAYKLTACLPSPYLPSEQGGAPLGMQVVHFSMIATFTNPATAGTYIWRVVVTPYVYGAAAADDVNAFEARTHVLFPYAVTLRATYQARTQTLVVSGRVLALGKPRAGVKVSLFADWMGGPADALTFAEVGKPTSRADGTFDVREPRKRILQPADRAKLEISALVDAVPGPCAPPAAAPAGCVDDSLSQPTTPFPGIDITIPPAGGKR